jgi:hypothetical protein
VAQLYPQAPATHFSRLLRHAWVTVGLFLFLGHHTGSLKTYLSIIYRKVLSSVAYFVTDSVFTVSSVNFINFMQTNEETYTILKTSAPVFCTAVGIYEVHLQSSWTHLITPSRNFVEVR